MTTLKRGCSVAKQLAGTCTCTICNLARQDRESPMDAGPTIKGRHGIRRWAK